MELNSPKSLKNHLFNFGSWVHNLTIDLNLTELTQGSELSLSSYSSDVGDIKYIKAPGFYSFSIKAYYGNLYLQENSDYHYGRVKGTYNIVDKGTISFQTPSFEYTTGLLALVLLVIFIKKKIIFDS